MKANRENIGVMAANNAVAIAGNDVTRNQYQ